MRIDIPRKLLAILACTFASAALMGCTTIAIKSTAKKEPKISTTPLAVKAKAQFWETLHNGEYTKIPQTTELLTAAYLENPTDPELAAYLGFEHAWNFTERNRNQTLPATVVNQVILTRKYFTDAVALSPDDPRFKGFLADFTMVEGQIFGDAREQTAGYFLLKDAIDEWPEFNYFTGGYVFSQLPVQSKHFQEGLEWQWKTLKSCYGSGVNPDQPSIADYLNLETTIGPKRACWNSWIAPHNVEGYYLNMGDMLVKNGDIKTAIKIYENAKRVPSYKKWHFAPILEKRIRDANKNIIAFNDPKNGTVSGQTPLMINSPYACMACHQK